MKSTICINGISRRSDKAILVNALVNYNSNASKEREIWMPKSVIEEVSDNFIKVEDWFLQKLSWQNAFHGYQMNFDRAIISNN